MTTGQAKARYEALEDAAKQLEHGAEFNATVAERWPAARQQKNTQLIQQSRDLHDRADQVLRDAGLQWMYGELVAA